MRSRDREQVRQAYPEVLNVRQAAAIGFASERQIRRMCADGRIYATKAGKRWSIPRGRFLAQAGAI